MVNKILEGRIHSGTHLELREDSRPDKVHGIHPDMEVGKLAASLRRKFLAPPPPPQPNWTPSYNTGLNGTQETEPNRIEQVNLELSNPFGAMQTNAEALHTAGVSNVVATPQVGPPPNFGGPAPPSNPPSESASPIPFGQPPSQGMRIPGGQAAQTLGIYDQTPFCKNSIKF